MIQFTITVISTADGAFDIQLATSKAIEPTDNERQVRNALGNAVVAAIQDTMARLGADITGTSERDAR